ncbi:MAG: MotA/TolQ/ExbB proton channel family protein [Sulfurovum sp.]|nr:MotA/TolQ/ExbB proton channel family protein [Sulfurovum sp.]
MDKSNYQSGGSCVGIYFTLFLIPFICVILLVLGYTGYLPFSVEMHTLITLGLIFMIFLFFIKHNASYSACKISNNFALMEDQLQDALKANALTIMGKTKSTLTVRDFIEGYFKGIRDDNFARVASSVFPMLGILGTFIAIALSMPDFTASSSEKLDQEISLLLSGIGTAFYASIYGIFLSLWWIFFERQGLARIEKSSQNLEEIYDSRIWKNSELIKHEHMQTELKDQKIIQTLQETFSLDFIKDLNNQYIRNFKTIIDDTTNSFERVTTHMESVSRDLRKTIEKIDERKESVEAVKTVKSDIRQFISGVNSLNDGLERFNGSVDHTFVKIDQELARSIDKLGEMAEIIVEQNLYMQKKLLDNDKEI